ncbi:MAG: hypothetical protein PHW00_03285 [Clostridia bacterium]|nr:hypothetical protein [Clostridia bacterium]
MFGKKKQDNDIDQRKENDKSSQKAHKSPRLISFLLGIALFALMVAVQYFNQVKLPEYFANIEIVEGGGLDVMVQNMVNKLIQEQGPKVASTVMAVVVIIASLLPLSSLFKATRSGWMLIKLLSIVMLILCAVSIALSLKTLGLWKTVSEQALIITQGLLV